jgi:hypothetical protein
MTRYAARKDTNHNEIAQALKAAGYTVVDASRLGDGFPDLVVIAPNGRVGLFENKVIENMRAGDMKHEILFMLKLVTPVYRIICDVEQAVEAMREIER